MTGNLLIDDCFDYSVHGDAVAHDMRAAADRIRQHTRAAFTEVGRELLIAKQRLEHGSFQSRVKAECQISLRTAERAMQVAELLEGVSSPTAGEGAEAAPIEQVAADALARARVDKADSRSPEIPALRIGRLLRSPQGDSTTGRPSSSSLAIVVALGVAARSSPAE